MLISCPKCATNFSVPDKALQPKGRMLKCAKCAHKWFQSPDVVAPPDVADDFALDATSFPPPEPEARPSFNPVRNPDPDLEFDTPPPLSASSRPTKNLDFDLDEPPVPDLGLGQKGNDPPQIDFDLEAPQPLPDVFNSQPATRKGTGGLWFLLLLLLLGGAGGAGYYFQDKLVDLWPPAHDLLSDAGLRREKPGAGLELRNAGTPERFVHNETEVLIVRGIIANVSDRERMVPTMKLVLLDKLKQPVQEKIQAPPVTALDAGGTAGFRIILERPDPNAIEVNVLFVDQVEAGK
jgi:predicted Zn finger-like uncharacterized protein